VRELRELDNGPDPATEPFAWQVMAAAAAAFGAADANARRELAALLHRWAGAHAMRLGPRPSANSRYALDRTLLPTIVAFWLLQGDAVWPPAARDEVAHWLDDLVSEGGAIEPGGMSARNNHHYLRGSVLMAWGALTGDAAAYARGPAAYRDALRDMRPDGSLPLETRRGARALWYQRHAIASLVTIAEMAAVQGQDLYGMEVDGRSLHTAVQFLLDGIADPRRVWRYAAANDKPGREGDYRRQDLSFLEPRGHGRHYMAWVEIYAARFPERPETRRLLTLVQPTRRGVRPMVDDYSGGNMTCFFARAGS
jgi:poly(beta-D-mannuronate) lyase